MKKNLPLTVVEYDFIQLMLYHIQPQTIGYSTCIFSKHLKLYKFTMSNNINMCGN